METNFFRKHLVISTIISIIGCFVISVMIGQVMGGVVVRSLGMNGEYIAGKYLQEAIGKLFAIIVTLVLICASGLFREIKTEKGKFKNIGILFGVVVIVALYNVIGDGIANRPASFSQFHLDALLACALYALATGALEEFVCRVLLFQNMCLKWKDKPQGVLEAVLVSSVVFGLCHLLNLSSGIGVTLFQVYYAVIAGIIFAAMYYVSKNIWVCILSHFLIDFFGVIGYAFMPNENAMSLANKLSTVDLSAVIIVAFMTVGAVYALILLRKQKKDFLDADQKEGETHPGVKSVRTETGKTKKHLKGTIAIALVAVLILFMAGGYVFTARNTCEVTLPEGKEWVCELKTPDPDMGIISDGNTVKLSYRRFFPKENELICTNNEETSYRYKLVVNGQMLEVVQENQ